MAKRTTTHSGRYARSTAKHNDRKFDLNKSDHIDQGKVEENQYRTCYGRDISFAEAEKRFYEETFKGMIADINARAEKERHPERKKTAEKLLKSKKTMPEEVIYEIGNKDDHVSPETLAAVFNDFYVWHIKTFGSHIRIIDMAMHLDEATPHIHVRQVWMYDNEKGFKAIGQNKALQQLGYELPDPNQPIGRNNNLKMQYSADCRAEWLQLCREHGVEVEEIPEKRPKSQQNLSRNDYILEKQKEELEENRETLDGQKQEVSDLKDEKQQLDEELPDLRQKNSNLKKQNQNLALIMIPANQKTAEKIISDAEDKAEKIITDADQQAADKQQEIDDLDSKIKDKKDSLKELQEAEKEASKKVSDAQDKAADEEAKVAGIASQGVELKKDITDFTDKLKESTDFIQDNKFFAPAVIQEIPAKIKHGRIIEQAVTIVATDDFKRLLQLAKVNSALNKCADAIPELKETGTQILSVSRELIKPREEWVEECQGEIEDCKNQAVKEIRYPLTNRVAFDNLEEMQEALDNHLVDPHRVFVQMPGPGLDKNYFEFYEDDLEMWYAPDPDLEAAVLYGNGRLYGYEEVVPRGLLNTLISTLEDNNIDLPEIISNFLGGNARIERMKKEISEVPPFLDQPSNSR